MELYAERKLLPHIEASGNPKRIAILWFMQSALSLIVGIIVVIGINTRYSSTYRYGDSRPVERYYYYDFTLENTLPPAILFGSISLVGLAGGIVYWKRYKKAKLKEKHWKLKKRKKEKKEVRQGGGNKTGVSSSVRQGSVLCLDNSVRL